MKVDVVILTYNDGDRIRDLLDSIDWPEKINRLIVVDGGSKDLTLDIIRSWCRRYNVKYRIVENIKGRGRARRIASELVETEWIAMFDSDVILSPRWIYDVLEHIDEDVGAVWSVEDPVGDPYKTVYDVMSIYYHLDRYNMSYNSQRYYTHNLLIRRDLFYEATHIDDYDKYHTFEDHALGLFITQRGYRWIKCLKARFLHNSRKRRWTKDMFYSGLVGARIGFYNHRYIVKTLLLGPLKSLVMILSGRMRVGLWNYYSYLVLAFGYLCCKLGWWRWR